jgi:hypothetical protein
LGELFFVVDFDHLNYVCISNVSRSLILL